MTRYRCALVFAVAVLNPAAAVVAAGPDNLTAVFPVRLETERHRGDLRVTGVQVRVPGEPASSLRSLRADELLMPEIVDYALADSGNPILFGIPPNGQPPGSARVSLLTDDLLNSGVFNIAADRIGLGLRFSGGLVNGPGPDLILAEISADVGSESAAAPGVPAPGGDRFSMTLPRPDQPVTLLVEPEDYVAQGLLGEIANHALDKNVALPSVAALEAASASWRATIDYMHLYVVAVDLSDLGVPPGERVDNLELRSMPIGAAGGDGDYASGDRYFYLDPMLIAGLPPV